MYYTFFLLWLIMMTSYSCNKSAVDDPLEVTPAPIQAGKEITIKYFPTHQKAIFKKASSLYASIGIWYPNDIRTYRIRLNREDNDDCMRGTFSIPENATFLTIKITVEEILMPSEKFASVVCIDSVPVKHSLPNLIYNSRTYEEACEIFETDHALYPDITDRYIPYWKKRIMSGIDTVEIKKEIDSLAYKVFTLALTDENDITSLSACAYAYTLLCKDEAVMRMLKRIRDSPILSKGLLLPARSSISAIWNYFFSPDPKTRKGNIERSRNIVRLLTAIAIQSNNVHLLTLASRAAVMDTDSQLSDIFGNSFTESISNILMNTNSEELIPNLESLYHTVELLIQKRKYNEVIFLTEKHVNAIDEATRWIRNDRSMVVSAFPAYGMESVLEYYRGLSYLKIGKEKIALRILSQLACRKNSEMYAYSKNQAIEILISQYIESDEFDSTKKYCAYALITKSVNSDSLYAEAKAKLWRYSFPSKDVLVKKYFEDHLTLRRALPVHTLQCEGHSYSFGPAFKDSLIILFSSRSCSICRVAIPPLLERMKATGRKYPQIIIISDETKDETFSNLKISDRSFVQYGKLTPELTAAFNIASFPSILVIKGNQLIYKGGINAEETMLALIEGVLSSGK